MKKIRKPLFLCVAALAMGGLSGCDFFTKPLDFSEKTTPTNETEKKEEQQDQPIDKTVHVESLSLNTSKLDLLVDQEEDLVATVLPENATNKAVKFSSLDTEIATVSSAGKVKGLKAGSTNIVVQSEENGAIFQICTVTVKEAYVPVESIVIGESSITLTKGQQMKLTASVLPEDASNKSLSWLSTKSSIVSVDEEGNINALELGSASIIVKSVDNPAAEAIFNISVEAVVVAVTGVELTQTALSLEENSEPVKLEAHVLPYNPSEPETEASNKSVIWTSSDSGVAAVSSDGTVTPESKGTTTIRATSAENATYYAECEIDVRKTDVESLTLDETSLAFSIEGNNEKQLTATITPDTATYKELVWSSSNPDVATVTNEGLVKTKGVVGTAIIIVTHVNSGLTATCSVTVVDASKLNIPGEVLESKYYQEFINNREDPNHVKPDYAVFADQSQIFEVGDDNAVNLFPDFEVEDDEHNIYAGSAWPYPFLINIQRKVGENEYVPATASEYTIVDAKKCDIKFSQLAAEANSVFKISIRADGYPDDPHPEQLTAEYEVKVVDGYNVTNEFELSYLDTCTEVRTEKRISSEWKSDRQDKVFYIDYPTFKTQHGLDKNLTPKTLVLQRDMSLGVGNLPSSFFYDLAEANEHNWSGSEKQKSLGSLKDYSYLYVKGHGTGDIPSVADDDFATGLSGNYFTLDYSRIPLVKRTNGKPTTELAKVDSHAKLFGCDVGTFELRNINLLGNAACAQGEDETYLAGGLTGFDVRYFAPSMLVKNVLAHSCYITFMNDEAANPKIDQTILTLDKCKLTDNYNCFIYNFGGDVIAKDCTFYGAGGAVVIQDHRAYEKWVGNDIVESWYDRYDTTECTFEVGGHPSKTVFEDCDIRNYVSGSEAWFKSFAIAGSQIGNILNLGYPFAIDSSNTNHLTYLFNKTSGGNYVGTADPTNGLLNFIVINKASTIEDASAMPIDGTVAFIENGVQVDYFNYLNPTSATDDSTEEKTRFANELNAHLTFRYIQSDDTAHGKPMMPLFETAGGQATYTGLEAESKPGIVSMAGFAAQTYAKPAASFYKGERNYNHLALYYMGMMLVFGAGYVGA